MATPPTFTSGAVLTAAQMNSVGLWLVKTQTIGAGVSSVAVTGAFSTDYENYKIIISGGTGSTTADILFNFTGSTANYYQAQIISTYATGAVTGSGSAATASWTVGYSSGSVINANVDIQGPFLAKTTQFGCARPTMSTLGSGVFVSGFHNVATSYTGFTLTPTGGTLTGGTIAIYGYKGTV
jgi:hypothetical protein